MAHRLSCTTACGILVLQPRIKPTSPALGGGFLTTEPPGKSLQTTFLKIYKWKEIQQKDVNWVLSDTWFCNTWFISKAPFVFSLILFLIVFTLILLLATAWCDDFLPDKCQGFQDRKVKTIYWVGILWDLALDLFMHYTHTHTQCDRQGPKVSFSYI